MTDAVPETRQGFEVSPLSKLMAAEIVGLDLTQPFDIATRDAVYRAFLDHQVLAFRNQSLTKDQQVAFTKQFGTLEKHAQRNCGIGAHPLVHIVTNLDDDGKPTGKVGSLRWHTDKSFRPQPSMATILHAVAMPPEGGDTVFANMYAAYDALSEDEKMELDGVGVVHSWELSRDNIGRTITEWERRDAPPMTHPLARTHPDTGRKCLFMGTHASHLEGIPMEKGRARIERLEAHATQPQFLYRHHWKAGDVLMWDNRCLLHHADANFDAVRYPRILHRTCLRGTPTG